MVHVTGGHAVGVAFLGQDVPLQEADHVLADGKHCVQSQCPMSEGELKGGDVAAQLHGEEVCIRQEHGLFHRLQAIGGVILEEQRRVAATHALHEQLVRLVVDLSLYVCGEVEGCWINRRGSQPEPQVFSGLRCEDVRYLTLFVCSSLVRSERRDNPLAALDAVAVPLQQDLIVVIAQYSGRALLCRMVILAERQSPGAVRGMLLQSQYELETHNMNMNMARHTYRNNASLHR